MHEKLALFPHHEGGETEAKYMTTMLLNCTGAVTPILIDERTQLNDDDIFALDILKKALTKIDKDIALGQTHTATFKDDEEDIEEKVLALVGPANQDYGIFASEDMPNYIDGQSNVKLYFNKEIELTMLEIYIDLVSNLGQMTLPEGTPRAITIMIAANFSDAFFRKIHTNIGLPNQHISYFIHYEGDRPMYHNNLIVNMAPATMPPEILAERLQQESIYSYSPNLIDGILTGEDITTKSLAKTETGLIHEEAVIQNVGQIYLPNVGMCRIFLKNCNQSVRWVEE